MVECSAVSLRLNGFMGIFNFSTLKCFGLSSNTFLYSSLQLHDPEGLLTLVFRLSLISIELRSTHLKYGILPLF